MKNLYCKLLGHRSSVLIRVKQRLGMIESGELRPEVFEMWMPRWMADAHCVRCGVALYTTTKA